MLFEASKTCLRLIITLVLSHPNCPLYSSGVIQSDFYERGVAQRDSGDWQQALEIWLAARDSMEKKHASDPRIGIAFIELVTEREALDYYDRAARMYFWGLGQADLVDYATEINNEIERISALLDKEEHKNWQKLLDKRDSDVLNEIKAFWIREDPIPTTEMNERLLEHWRRIAYADSNFKNDDNTVYGTDDRGLVFVKYGAADAIYKGKLGTDQLEIIRWIDDFLLRQEIQRFNNHPDFEIWIYRSLKEDESTIFLFGKKAGFGQYGLRYGIEDLIPERAFRRSSTHTTRGILPGTMLQLMYYRELIGVDHFYLNRYRELEARWANARGVGEISPDHDVLKGLMNHYKSLDRKTAQFEGLRTDLTNAYEGLERLYLNFKAFRYLDRRNEPRLSMIVVSSNEVLDDNFVTPFFKLAQKTKYKHRHILITYDDNWEMKDRIVEYPDLNNYNTSAFSLSHDDPADKYRLVAEKVILEVRKAELDQSDIPDTAKVIGINSSFLGEVQPLSGYSSSFEISDLIVGKKTPAEVAESLSYPFPVIPVDPVKSASIQVYLQLYHLKLDKVEKAGYGVECQLQAIKDKGKVDKKKERLKRAFDFTAYEKNTGKTFDLYISNLKPGKYELTLKVTDKNSKQKKVRKSTFRIAG